MAKHHMPYKNTKPVLKSFKDLEKVVSEPVEIPLETEVSKLVEIPEPVKLSKYNEDLELVTVNCPMLNIREQPSTITKNILFKVKLGTKLRLLYDHGEWLKVRSLNKPYVTGYTMSKFCDRNVK